MSAIKSVIWSGNSRERLSKLPQTARRELGYQIFQLQQGVRPVHTKPFKTGGPIGIFCLRHADNGGWFRLTYVVRGDNIYVLHVFQKSSNRTTVEDSNLIKSRYNDHFGRNAYA